MNRTNGNRFLLILGIALSAGAGFLSMSGGAHSDSPVALDPSADLVVETHSLVFARDFTLFAKESDLIVVGVVGEVGAPYRFKQFDREGLPDSIQRDAIIEVDEVLKGPTDLEQVTVSVQGGEVGSLRVVSMDGASLQSGEEVLLFLGTNNLGNHVVFAGQNGKYTLRQDGLLVGSGDFEIPLDELRDEVDLALGSQPE